MAQRSYLAAFLTAKLAELRVRKGPYPEIQAALLTIDRTTRDGRRDYALPATMFNTGARVQETLDVRPSDVQLVPPAHVRLFGKGRKERLCPLWPQTAQLLRACHRTLKCGH